MRNGVPNGKRHVRPPACRGFLTAPFRMMNGAPIAKSGKPSERRHTTGRTKEKIQDQLFPLVDEILSLKASTPAGLAVQAKAVAYAAADLWDPPDLEETHERLFIEAACAFCNITPWPIAWRLRTAAEQNS